MNQQLTGAEASSYDSGGRTLRRDSVHFFGTVGHSVGIQAPSGGVTFLPALMAGIVGLTGPLAFTLAIGAMLFVAYAFVLYTREFASAGSVYAFNGTAMGPSYGFVSAWLLLFVYIAYAASVYSSGAAVVGRLLPAGAVPWPWIAVAGWVVTVVLTYRSIRVSAAVTLAFEAVAVVLTLVVAVAVIVHGGYHGHSLSAKPFTANGLGFSTIGLGVVFGFTGFSGFEVAATLGEESGTPRRVIPTAMVTALLVSGGIYVLMSWVETVALPLKTLQMGNVVLPGIASTYVFSGFGTIINVAAILSGLGAQFACANGATRLLFALSRDGFGPRSLTRTSPRTGTPTTALAVVAVISLVAFLPLVGSTPLGAFSDLATYGADLIIMAYLLSVVGAFVWSVRNRKLNPARLLILLVGAAVLAYILYDTIVTLVAPFDYCMYGAVFTLAVGVLAIVGNGRLRRRLADSPLFTVFHELPASRRTA
ncbi:MAG: APC family permease [Acidimicrobiales bacterium]